LKKSLGFEGMEEEVKLKFEKMHATGNDFILVNGNDIPDKNELPLLARKLCRRHFGIGADGLLAVSESKKADCRMHMFNPDGTESTCGNGLRCAALFALEHKLVDVEEFVIETQGRIMSVKKTNGDFSVDMGEPILEARDIPVAGHTGKVIKHPFNFGDMEFEVTCVSMGNPHAVIFVDDLDYYDIRQLGPLVENSRHYFPDRTNVMLVQVKEPGEIEIKIWERGAGATLSCGTGACAAVVAGVLTGFTDRKVHVDVPGGVLDIEYPEKGGCKMRGNTAKVFEGWVEI
jgi:diaminopimelate epimerase